VKAWPPSYLQPHQQLSGRSERLHLGFVLRAVLFRAVLSAVNTWCDDAGADRFVWHNLVEVSALVDLYYYTYSVFSIIANAALDRLGSKNVIPAGILPVAIGQHCSVLASCWSPGSVACCKGSVQPVPSLARCIW
jgi:MFS family permease